MIKSFLYYPPNVNLCFRLFFSKKLIAYQHGFNVYKIYTEKSITFFLSSVILTIFEGIIFLRFKLIMLFFCI